MREATKLDIHFELWLRERNNSEIIWTTKEGTTIPINQMSRKHLENVNKMLDRNEQLAEIASEFYSYEWDLD